LKATESMLVLVAQKRAQEETLALEERMGQETQV
jgi:hypothetical protein